MIFSETIFIQPLTLITMNFSYILEEYSGNCCDFHCLVKNLYLFFFVLGVGVWGGYEFVITGT
jgi:hypothetical protein